MARRKTTLYRDADLRTATKVVAATDDRSESEVGVAVATRDVTALMQGVTERGEADGETAMALAVNEVRATRRARQR